MSRLKKWTSALARVEALWALLLLVKGLTIPAVLVGLFAAMMGALSQVFSWVSIYGWAGWFLAAVASAIIISFLVGALSSAWVRFDVVRAKRRERIAANTTSHTTVPALALAAGDIQDSRDRTLRLEEQFLAFSDRIGESVTSAVRSVQAQQRLVDEIAGAFGRQEYLKLAIMRFNELETKYSAFDDAKTPSEAFWQQWPLMK